MASTATVCTSSVEISSVENHISTNTDDLLTGSADCADGWVDMTNNNDIIGDILNYMDTK